MRTRFVSPFTTKPFAGIALLVVITAALAGWSATGYADAGSSQSLEGAWNVTDRVRHARHRRLHRPRYEHP